MKKVFLTLSLVLLSLGAFAQSADQFFPGWYLGAKGGISLTAGETHANNLLSPRAALDLGYQFTPVFGLRAQASAWEGKGALPQYEDLYKYNFGQLNLDGIFDLCNLFGKYKYNRLFNPYVFVGLGLNTRFNNDEAQAVKPHFPEKNWLWDNPVLSFTGRFGLGTDIRLTDGLALTLELADNVLSDHFNSKVGDAWTLFGGVVDFDYQLTALAGLKFSFGAAKRRAAALAAAEKAAAEAAARAAATNLVFFYNIRVVNFDQEDDAKLQELVNYVKNGKVNMIYIKGYADKGTGNPYVNRKYAKQRAENIKKALVNKYGIDSKLIECLSYGDTVQPYAENDKNRCATIFVEFE